METWIWYENHRQDMNPEAAATAQLTAKDTKLYPWWQQFDDMIREVDKEILRTRKPTREQMELRKLNAAVNKSTATYINIAAQKYLP